MITLIIKGDIAAAFKAADAYGVELCALATHNKFNECIASTIPECLPKVVHWYCDTTRAPYPAGTLMFYSEPRG
jgi:hypothetical protein